MNKQQEPKPARKRPWRKPRVLLAVAMLLAATVLPALSQAQFINICDRTPQVRDAILKGV